MNASGIEPTGYQVLVKPVEVEKKTAGGIYLPDETHERDEHASDEGTLVAVSPGAFTFDANVEARAPAVGASVIYPRYAGKTVKGLDGNYRLMNDQDILAVRA